MSPGPENPAASAESLFAQWLAAHAMENATEFSDFCRQHAVHERELRDLHAQWQRISGIQQRAGQGGSLAERLVQRYGESVEPHVSLHAKEDGASTPFTEAVMARLTGRSVASGRYEIRGEIARGGMGAILRVWDEDLRRNLAMKVILGQGEPASSGATPPEDSKKLARFLEEAQVTGQLDHPGIVPVHELGLDATGRVYFTMKLVKGQTLKEVFDDVGAADASLATRSRVDAPQWKRVRALGVLLKVCEAMAYAHDKGVIHRDLKPGNVMVGKYGEVYVMDWGLARVLSEADKKDVRIQPQAPRTTSSLLSERAAGRGDTPESPLYTMDGDIVGTPAYMSPEQASGDLARMGPHSDVYAVGAMLYHLLAGHMPYVPRDARMHNYAVWAAVQNSAPPPIEKLARDAPAELVATCEKAMAREIVKRYRDMSELARDLGAFLEGRVVAAYRTGAWAETKKWVQRNKPLAASLAAVGVLLVVGLITSLTLKDKADANLVLAKDNAKRADAKTEEANRLAQEATEREQAATERADALWAIEELKNFNALDDDQEWKTALAAPVWKSWLEKAHELVDGRPEDLARGVRRKPGRADHERLLAKVRESARPATEAELAADRASHPKAKVLESKRAELEWYSRVLGLEPWPHEAEVQAQLDSEKLPDDSDWNELAWSIVNPDSRRFGQEWRALLLARRAVAAPDDERGDRAMRHETLAWALLWTAQTDRALVEARNAIEESAGSDQEPKLELNLSRMQLEATSFRDGTARTTRDALKAAVSALEREVSKRRTWHFDDSEKAWWSAHLEELIDGLHDLQHTITIAERSVLAPDSVKAWNEAIEAIAASPKYGGLRLTPQLGLLPIGPDPESGLWEFANLSTGEPAVRGAGGKIELKPENGMVLVLLPAGRVPTEDGKKPTPLNDALLDAFFLSKYEMTVAQWNRVSRWTGSFWQRVKPLMPAHAVSWDDCMATLERAGLFLRLPTEAQWEYGCRAGTTTPWWTGASEESLHGAENIDFDRTDKNNGEIQLVCKLRANPFGLHDVHGNVWEWCHDGDGGEDSPVRPGDGERQMTGSRLRVLCGGGFSFDASLARSGQRYATLPVVRSLEFGLRAARASSP